MMLMMTLMAVMHQWSDEYDVGGGNQHDADVIDNDCVDYNMMLMSIMLMRKCRLGWRR